MNINVGPDEKLYPVTKVATVLDALADEGVDAGDFLARAGLSKGSVASPATRVSINQVLDGYRFAAAHTRDPHFAYRTGQRLHVSAYGMYGFAILSSMNYRQTMQFAMAYHRLAMPLATIEFQEHDGQGIWVLIPFANPRIDAGLYKFIIEMQFGIMLSLHRDVMGPSFSPRELNVSYRAPDDAASYPGLFEAPVQFGQPQNRFIYDAGWLDGTPTLGNEITHATVLKLCEAQNAEFDLHRGLVGKVRRILMLNLMRPIGIESVAAQLHMTERTLRRKLRHESTSFRSLADQLRMDMAIRYLRDTTLTVEDIAGSLGFSDAANFRRAFRRWTNAAPHEFRGIFGGT